jgi:hypothetical protein
VVAGDEYVQLSPPTKSKEQIVKSKRWYIKFPADAYALGPVTFKKEVSEEEVMEYAREEFEKVCKLPDGFQCWPA